MAHNDIRLQKAQASLNLKWQYLSWMMYRLLREVHVLTPDHPMYKRVLTAATDAKAIYWNQEFLGKLRNVQEIVFVQAHEIVHVMLKHVERGTAYRKRGSGPNGKPLDDELWHKAIDYVTNILLTDGNIGTMPKAAPGLLDVRFRGMTADAVYNFLWQEQAQQGGKGKGDGQPSSSSADGDPCPGQGDQPGDQPGEGDGAGQASNDPAQADTGNGRLDTHLDKAEDAASEATIDAALNAATDIIKSMGTETGGMLEMMQLSLRPPQIPWHEKLKRKIQGGLGSDRATWHRPNRRRLGVSMLLPEGKRIVHPGRMGLRAGKVGIVIDCSGSISSHELRMFCSETAGILNGGMPDDLRVYWTDAVVKRVDVIKNVSDLHHMMYKGVPGRGGTYMPAAYPEIEKQQGKKVVIIVLTDGWTGWSYRMPPCTDHITVYTDRDTCKYGTSIGLGMNTDAR